MQTHHVSLLSGEIEKNKLFYMQILGLRFIKNSINQANAHMRHIYYGDFMGTPGTVVTFFVHPKLDRPRVDGRMFFSGLHFGIPAGTMPYWQQRLETAGRPVTIDDRHLLHTEDLEAIPVVLKEVERAVFDWHTNFMSDIPAEKQITGVLGAELHVPDVAATANFFETMFHDYGVFVKGNVINLDHGQAIYLQATAADTPDSKFGAGSTDHYALAVASSVDLDYLWERAKTLSWQRELYVDRGYFNSIYLIEPAGNRVEVATLNPGVTLDESIQDLGTTFAIPPRFEASRQNLLQWYAERGVHFDDVQPYTGTGKPDDAPVTPVHAERGNTRND